MDIQGGGYEFKVLFLKIQLELKYLNIERDESVERNKAKDIRERECLEHSL